MSVRAPMGRPESPELPRLSHRWRRPGAHQCDRVSAGALGLSIKPEIAALLPDWHGRVALFTYYACAQVLTIGYSDVTPVRAPATTLSLFAALFGVFYTAIVVSVFVGLAQSGKGGGGHG